MSSLIKSPKDFWTGILFFGFSAIALLAISRDYSLDQQCTGRVISRYVRSADGVRGLGPVTRGPPARKRLLRLRLETIRQSVFHNYRFCLPAATRAGLIIALLVLISSQRQHPFPLEWRAAAGARASRFRVLVFVKGLGLPMFAWNLVQAQGGRGMELFANLLPAS